MQISVLIKTIGRHTIQNAIDSAHREGFNDVIVVSDGKHNVKVENATFIELPKQWGFYGSVAANVGIAYCTQPYTMILDDDDELEVGAGDIIRNKIDSNPDIDIWIPGLKRKSGLLLCCPADDNKVVVEGNVAVPICKTEVFIKTPFRTDYGYDDSLLDFGQIKEAVDNGYKIDWIQKPTYLVRPKVPHAFGRGGKQNDKW